MRCGLRVKSGYPQASETLEPPESEFEDRCVLQPSSCNAKTPGNLRFTALLGKGKCEVGKPTGAGEGIRTLDPNLGKVVLYP